MDKKELDEILIILAEECAELQQAATKIIRFGSQDISNINQLQDEMGDVLALLSILDFKGVVNSDKIMKRVPVKLKKLKKYSDITELDDIISGTK